jgi:hypothetical protein
MSVIPPIPLAKLNEIVDRGTRKYTALEVHLALDLLDSRARVKELEEELDGIAAYLEVRANDPWPDELWPAANVVLTQVARELRALRGEEER